MNKLEKIEKVFDEISKKALFVCEDQIIEHEGKKYNLPKCKEVKLSFKDYNKLYDVIKNE